MLVKLARLFEAKYAVILLHWLLSLLTRIIAE
jgi:hypothetical protein